MLVQGRGRELISKIEELSLVGHESLLRLPSLKVLTLLVLEQSNTQGSRVRTTWNKACRLSILSR